MYTRMFLAAVLANVAVAPALAERSLADEGAEVYFISPEDDATVTNPVTILFGTRGMGIAPAGIDVPDTGHHHLLINVAVDEIDFDEGIPADDRHRHFGGGQTEVTLELPQGTHELRLLMGDHAHIPHDPPVMSEPLSITVE